ncbi:zinc finger CCHC domain-containing protein 7 [Rhinophrynus dorsalis]
MFNDDEDILAYEDELYCEESSSDESIDSEVEFNLYSQVHYSQNLSKSINEEEADTGRDKEECVLDEKKQLDTDTRKETEHTNIITLSDSDEIKVSYNSPIIILSDTTEEDSVYSTKTKRKGSVTPQHAKGTLYIPGSHSTPNDIKASTPHKKVSSSPRLGQLSTSKSYKGGLVQEVVVIRGSSEDDDANQPEEDYSMSDSDQSDLEHWMLLGREREDGDTSIQLNLEGSRNVTGGEGERGVEWSISEKDIEAQIENYTPSRRSSRYYADKNVVCRNCNKRGHLSKNCPTPKKFPACCLCGERGHNQKYCPARYCSNCSQPGHSSNQCIEKAYWKKDCHRCSMKGHYADACPEIWRQYHLTVKPGPIRKPDYSAVQKETVYCCNCGRGGHCSYECSERRMVNGTFPTAQLVTTYDRNNDIWNRNLRVKNKIKAFQDAGLLPLKKWEDNRDLEYMQPFKKMKKKHLKKSKLLDQQGKKNNFNKQQYMAEKRKKKILLQSLKIEEDFPRGGSVKFLEEKRYTDKNANNMLFNDVKKNLFTRRLSKKRRDRLKVKRENSTAIDESLFIIKQKKKKSKKGIN